MDEEVNPLERDHSLSVVLPGGLEKNATVHGSKPVMDFLVTLCASYHLNPSDYTIEFLSPNKNNISFKPNSPIGSLEAEKMVLKPKGGEGKPRRPYMPEATVRLLINYNKSHKTVVRVNPRIPLEFLLPQVCEKCEFKVESTVLLTYCDSKEPLDLTRSLNDYGLREVFAKDTTRRTEHQQRLSVSEPATTPTKVMSPPAVEELQKKEKKTNGGFLSLFCRQKKKSEMDGAVSSPTSPDLNKQTAGSVKVVSGTCANTVPVEMPKKRRAPQPPIGASQSVPNSLGTCHLTSPQRSADSTLRSTKRRAPLPPCPKSEQELQGDTEVKVTVHPHHTLKELSECDESDSVNLSLFSSSSSSSPSHPQSSSSFSHPSLAHLHQVADSYLPTIRGKDLSDARCALAKVLTSSLSGGTLVKRLKNSTSFPKMYQGSCFSSATEWCPENEVETRAQFDSGLYTEQEWEDPVRRKRMTTFRIIPLKTNMSHILDIPSDVPEQYQVSPGDATEMDRCFPETEDACSPDKLATEMYLVNPDPCSQETQASTSTPPPLELDNQRCLPLSQVEAVVEVPNVASEFRDCGETSKEEYEVGSVPESQEDEVEDNVRTPKETQESVEIDDIAPDSPLTSTAPPPELDHRRPLSLFQVEDVVEVPKEPSEFGHCGEASAEEYQVESVPEPQEDEDEVGDDIGPRKESEESVEVADVAPDSPSMSTPLPPELDNGRRSSLCQVDAVVEVPKEVDVAPDSPSGQSRREFTGELNPEDRELTRSHSSEGSDKYQPYISDEEQVEEEVARKDDDEESFPPPPPPVFFTEDPIRSGIMEVGSTSVQLSSSSSNGKIDASAEDARSELSPSRFKTLGKMSAGPSRFAQAVALAVQKSRLLGHGKASGPQVPSGPHSTLPSVPTSTYQYGA